MLNTKTQIILFLTVVVFSLLLGLGIGSFMGSKFKQNNNAEIKYTDKNEIASSQTEQTDTSNSNMSLTENTNKWKQYTNARYGFTVLYPDNWSIKETSQNGDGAFFVTENKNNDVRAFASFSDENSEEYFENTKISGKKVIDIKTIQGFGGKLIIGEDKDKVQYEYIIVNEQIAYTFYALLDKEYYALNKGILDEIIKNIKIESQSVNNSPKHEDDVKNKVEQLLDKANELIGKKESLKFFDEALKLDPNNAEIYHSKGLSLRVMGDNSEALRNYEKAIELNPNEKEYYLGKASVLKDLSRYNEAKKFYEKALELSQNDREFAVIVCVSEADMLYKNMQEYDEAIKLYDKAMELNTNSEDFDDATIFVFKGNCYDAQGNSDEALNMYKKASELDSKWEYMYQWYLNYKAK